MLIVLLVYYPFPIALSLLKKFGVREKDYYRIVSDAHVKKFSYHYSEGLELQPPFLEMKNVVVKDVDFQKDQKDKCFAFLTKWKSMFGSGATYKRLICALLKIQRFEAAEAVCKMLQTASSVSISGMLNFC